jgi:hypothetical protein
LVAVNIGRWVRDRRWWLTIVPPYVALAAVFALGAGVYETKADQAHLRVEQAVIAADLAAERALDAQEEADELARETRRSCLDRQQARADVDEVFRTIGAALPPRIALQIITLLAERPPIEC